MKSISVAPAQRFNELRKLPDSFNVDDTLYAKKYVSGDADAMAKIIRDNPDISARVTWASFVQGVESVTNALKDRTCGTLLGRYTLKRVRSDEVLGYFGIFPDEQEAVYGMGYFVEESARGKGYATRALGAAIDVVTATLHPKSLYLQIAPENMSSIAMAAHYGFQKAETVWDPDLGMEEQRFVLELSDA